MRARVRRAVRWVLTAGLVLGVVACGSVSMVDQPSQNQDGRVRYLVLHFTSENFQESLRLLTQPTSAPVSAHYLVPAPGDPTYPEDKVIVHRLVPETQRAWHAGSSRFDGASALNASSIGVEIVNESRCIVRSTTRVSADGRADLECRFLPYPEAQLRALVELAAGILERHPDIAPWRVVGHADVAPERKVDPGPLFPWERLHEAGIGAWYDPARMQAYRQDFLALPPSLACVQAALAAWGYGIAVSGRPDERTRVVLRAFQMHFRPAAFDGRADVESVAILFALLAKYRPEALRRLAAAGDPTCRGGAAAPVT